jgi:hypothetical protein
MVKEIPGNVSLVSAYISGQPHALSVLLEATRRIILSADSEVGEQIKWNVPAFYYTGEMKPFAPKEYKRDIVVFNVHKKGHLLLVFPSGAKVNDTSGLLTGSYTDGRRLATIYNTGDLADKEAALKEVIRKWIALVDK